MRYARWTVTMWGEFVENGAASRHLPPSPSDPAAPGHLPLHGLPWRGRLGCCRTPANPYDPPNIRGGFRDDRKGRPYAARCSPATPGGVALQVLP